VSNDSDTDVDWDGIERRESHEAWINATLVEKHKGSPRQIIVVSSIAVAVAISVLVLDLIMPLGVAGGVPYVALVLVGWWTPNRGTVFLLAAISSVLTVVGYFFSPEGGVPWVVLTNRAYAIFSIWITAIILWVARRSRALTRRSEANLMYAKQRAEAANVAKSEFLATVSHELRTPLNAISGFTDSILHETFGPLANDKYREYLEDIKHSGNHLNKLVNDILDVSAIEAKKLELREKELDIGELIEDTVRMMAPSAEMRNITISVSIEDAMPPLYADERRLHEILLNILSNAVKFSHQGGEVSLDVAIDGNGWMKFTISDNGIGMNEKELVSAMERFGQVDGSYSRKFQGTGLGLPLTRSLTELHGGKFRITSEKGVGTKVTVKFPSERVVQETAHGW